MIENVTKNSEFAMKFCHGKVTQIHCINGKCINIRLLVDNRYTFW